MKDIDKTKEQLIDELEKLRQRIKDLEISEIERIQNEQILKESERKYRLLVESSIDMMFAVDLDGNFLFVNEALVKNLGYPENVIKNTNGFDLVHPEDTEKVKQQFSQLVEGKKVDNMEYRYKTREGSYIHILNNAAPIFDFEGNVVAALGIARDITPRKKMEEELHRARNELEQRVQERTAELLEANKRLRKEIKEHKRTEEELRKSEEKYRDLVENLSEVIYTLDEKGIITYVSPVSESLFGYSSSELLSRSFPEKIYQEDLSYAKSNFQMVLSGQNAAGEYRILSKSGKIRWIRSSSRPIFKGNRVIGAQGVLTDISDRKVAEKELRESEEKFRTLAEKSPSMIFINKMGQIVYANKRCEEVLGYKRKEFYAPQFNFLRLISPDSVDLIKNNFAKHMKGEDIDPYEYNLITKNGKKIEAIITTRLINYEGEKAILGIVTDITEFKKTEEMLRQNEERFRTIVETAPGMLMITDSDGKNIYISPNCKKLLGYSQEELMGKMIWWVHEDDTSRAKKIYEQTFQKGTGGKDFEYKAVKKNGEIWHASSSWEPLRDKEGKFQGVIMQTIDITERKRAEAALRESEEKYRAIFESFYDVYYRTDKEGVVTIISPSVKSQAGYEPEDVIGRPVTDFYLNPADRDAMMEELKKTRAVNDFELKLLAKDGSVIEASASSNLVFDKDGNPIGVEGTLRNITERKRAEEELQAREAYLEQLFESAQEAIVMTDSKGKILRVNKEFIKLFGYGQQEIVSRKLDELIVPDNLQEMAVLSTQSVSKGESISFEAIRQRKDGRQIDVSVLAAPIIIGGKFEGMYGIYRDITERKQAEKQIKASLKEKEVLLQEVHHRVKNNMQIISSLHNLQSKQIQDTKAMEIFKSIQNRVKSMALIHERLYQSKDFSQVNCTEYVRSLTNHLFSSYGIDPQVIKLSIDIKDVSLNINTAVPCGLIISELVTNSLKYGFPEGKKGEIKVAMHALNANEIELIVSDNGVGLPKDINIRNTESLGLHLVSLLAEDQLHGKIKVDRTEGTSFHIKLKMKK